MIPDSLSRREAGAMTVDQIYDGLEVSPDDGLSGGEAELRLGRAGANEIRQRRDRTALQILGDQFKSVIILLLVAAGAAALVIGETVEGAAVFAVIAVNAVIGFFTEMRAVRSMQALRRLGRATATVRRDGRAMKIPASRVVPGDLALLNSGDLVPADMRLVEANRLQADEAALTGESVPVSKHVEPLSDEAALAEQGNVVFKGTPITRGSGRGVVIATGMETEIGHISRLVEEAEEEKTPLERRLNSLARKLLWLTLGIAAAVAAVGVAVGRDLLLMVETSIALAVASVPEGLPITATIALARGMKRMADRNALVTELSTVETLGSTNIVCTDKTGTLTEGRMSVRSYELAGGSVEVRGGVLSSQGEFRRDGEPIDPRESGPLSEALMIGVLCSNASVSFADGEPDPVGEPIEVALQIAGLKAGYEREELLDNLPEQREVAFDPGVKMMATYHARADDGGGLWMAVKGAPEAVLEACTRIRTDGGTRSLEPRDRERWDRRNREMAREGMRVLALASKTAEDASEEPYEGLTFVGLAALLDPPRKDVRGVIDTCRRAGIRVVMATGDQELTARKVAEVVGISGGDDARVIRGDELGDDPDAGSRKRIVEANVLTRVSPEQKLVLIQMHQDGGNVVAMTGDGVNDAPALKKADIGVAMGRGTQVARDAADMVLQDNVLGTIIVAVEQGRIIFQNIRSFMTYLLSSNVGTILTVGIAALLNAPLPLLPLQILFLNVVVDVFPALALGVGEGDEDVIERPPRDPQTPVMEARHWRSVSLYGLLIAAAVLAAFLLAHRALGLAGDAAVTISFLTLMLAKLWHVFNMRGKEQSALLNAVTGNPFVWASLGLCAVLILAAVYLPGLSEVLRTVRPDPSGWGLALGLSVVPLAVGQALKGVGWLE